MENEYNMYVNFMRRIDSKSGGNLSNVYRIYFAQEKQFTVDRDILEASRKDVLRKCPIKVS